jgi:hypothetical protein
MSIELKDTKKVTVGLDAALLERVKSVCKAQKKKIKFKDAVEFGLEKFLEEIEKRSSKK